MAAAQQVAQAIGALTVAEATITRLEAENETLDTDLLAAVRGIEHMQRQLTEAQAARQISETRAADLEQHILAVRAELVQARAAERELAKLEGETEALRRQVAAQQELVERLSAARPPA